jgi:transposase-like protein
MLTQKRCRYGQKIKKFTIADRLAILHEYETSDLTGAEIAQKYGIKSASTISTWKRRLYNSKKSSTFAGENKRSRAMEDAERQQLLAQITGLQRQLEKSEMEKLALNTLIDIAEEQGLQIRKKSGAKQ